MTPTSSLKAVIAIVAVAICVTGACSPNDPHSTTTSVAGPGTTAAATRTVAKSTMVTQADELCRLEREGEGDPAGRSPGDIEAYFRRIVAARRARIQGIEAIGTPDADAELLRAAVVAMSESADVFERKIPSNAANPAGTFADPEIVRAEAEAAAAAKRFGFTICEQPVGSSATTTTTNDGSAGSVTPPSVDLSAFTPAQLAELYLSGVFPGVTFDEAQVSCVATNVFAVPSLASLPFSTSPTVDDKERYFTPLIGCIGMAPLLDTFMANQAALGWTAEQTACARSVLERADTVAILSGDPVAEDGWVARVKVECHV